VAFLTKEFEKISLSGSECDRKKGDFMKNLRRLGIDAVVVAFAVLACSWALGSRAQTGGLDLSQLQLVASNAIPSFGNFYFAQNYGIVPRATGMSAFGPPLPFDPRPDLPLYAMNDGNSDYLIDDYGVDYSAQAQSAGMTLRPGGMMAMDSGAMLPAFSFASNSLWLQITNVANGLTCVNLNNATDVVYEILTTTDLNTNWTTEEEVWSTNQIVMPFTIPQNGRSNLFVWAMDWTGVTENGNTTPEWWFWSYFGSAGLMDTNLDSRGNTLGNDYTSGYDPNVIIFSLSMTNQYLTTSTTTLGMSVTQGEPFYVASLVDDNNLADANWLPYASTNVTVNVGTSSGWHDVWVGMTGHSGFSTPSWQYVRLKYDVTAPTLVVTNPAPGTVMQPILELQGYSPKALSSITYDLSNSAVSLLGQPVSVLNQHYDTNTWELTTNTFEAFDLPLALGTNIVTLHATDLAGNTTSTNLIYTLDYSGKTNPPGIALYWPQNGTQMSGGGSFTWRGHLDDFTASVIASFVDTNGNTNVINGLVERDGDFWIENVPISAGTNSFNITATDVVGNSNTTNVSVVESGVTLTIDTLTSNQLSAPEATVTGTIGTIGYKVWVNGVQAIISSGSWTASNVMFPSGGTALVQARAITNTDNGGNGSGGGGTASYVNPGNPSSSSAVDTEDQQDKPPRFYVDTYTENESGMTGQSETDYWALGVPTGYWSYDNQYDVAQGVNWADGVGGTGNWTWQELLDTSEASGPETNSFQQNTVWPPSSWPGVLGGTVTRTGYGSDDYDTNAGSPVILEHCDIGVPVVDGTGSYQTGTPFIGPYQLFQIVQKETRHAQATTKLFTGGKGLVGQTVLCVVTDAVTPIECIKLPPPFYLDGPFPATPPVPPTSVKAGELGYLGTDGVANSIQPGGVTVDATASVAGLPYFTNNPVGGVAPLHITANSIVLSNDVVVSNANFLVGQFITFTLTGVPSDVVATNFHWSFGGDYFNAQSNAVASVSFPTCSLDPYINQSLLTAPVSTNFWVSGGVTSPNIYSATVNLTLVPTNGNPAQSCTVQGAFYMLRPLPAFYVQIRDQVRVDSNQWVNGSPSGTTRLYFGINHNPSNVGIAFGYTNAPVAPLSTNTYGQYFVTQVIDSYTVEYNLVSGGNCSGYETNDTLGLDTQYPYGGISSQSTNFEWTDSPGQQLSVALWLYEANSFSTYLMFQPNVGGNSVAVPMYKTEWNWYGSATNNPWGLKSGSAAASPAAVTEQFPNWTHIIAGLNTMPQYMIQTNCFPEN
jgi:hypothetical protein